MCPWNIKKEVVILLPELLRLMKKGDCYKGLQAEVGPIPALEIEETWTAIVALLCAWPVVATQ